MLANAVSIDRELAKRSLAEWVKLTWHLVEPGPLIWNWHIDVICEHLEAVSKGEITRLLINVPPGTMKSLLCGVFWPTWEWSVGQGDSRWLTASFDASLTRRDAGRSLELLTSDWYMKRFGDRILVDPDSSAIMYENQLKGWRMATSVEGKSTGWHADFQLIDDPTKPKEATKDNLMKTREWLQGTMSLRWRDPAKGRRVIVMQRLHDLDLSGLAIEEGYTHLRLPMEYEKKYPCYTKVSGDPRTEDGQPLWLGRYPAEILPKLKHELGGAMNVAAQFQQRPVPEGGSIFKREHIKTFGVMPARFDQVIISWDCAFKGEADSDFVVGQVWGRVGADYYLLDQVRGRWDFPRTLIEVAALAKKWPQARAKLIEDKANGPAVLSTFSKKIPGMIPVNPEGGKESRANAAAPLFEAGNVHVPLNAPWVESFILECISFPMGANDDQVDACTQALTYMYGKHTRIVEAMRKLQGLQNR